MRTGFMPNGERKPGCWVEDSDGCSVLSADGLNEWYEILNRGYFQDQGMMPNVPPAPEGGWSFGKSRCLTAPLYIYLLAPR
jgi:hypothetical protein